MSGHWHAGTTSEDPVEFDALDELPFCEPVPCPVPCPLPLDGDDELPLEEELDDEEVPLGE